MLGKRDGRDDYMNYPPSDGVGFGGNEFGMQQENQQQQTQQQKPKALRFVTNYGAPHPKRRRIGAACLTCMRALR